jgi:hypothetical protein
MLVRAMEISVKYSVTGLVASEVQPNLSCSRDALCQKTGSFCKAAGKEPVCNVEEDCGGRQCECNVNVVCPDGTTSSGFRSGQRSPIKNVTEFEPLSAAVSIDGGKLPTFAFLQVVTRNELLSSGIGSCLESCGGFRDGNCSSFDKMCDLSVQCFHDHCVCNMVLGCGKRIKGHGYFNAAELSLTE